MKIIIRIFLFFFLISNANAHTNSVGFSISTLTKKILSLLFIFFLQANISNASDILIYNNQYGDNEQDLKVVMESLGHTVTIRSGPNNLPDQATLNTYDQVWDIGANQAIPSADETKYISYLQNGGALFLMGENTGYGAIRNADITPLITTLGGGSTSISSDGTNNQTVSVNLQDPNSISTVSYPAAGFFQVSGGVVGTSGECLTYDSNDNCGAVAFSDGDLANASTGTLVSVLDINFMDTDSYSHLQPFTENIISYIATQQAVSNGLPILSSSNPANNATGVSSSTNIVLTFSEAVDVETGNITIKKTSDDSDVETIDVTSIVKVTGSGSTTITVNPDITFDAATEYYVLIDATAFDDVDGNSYAGISSTTALSFTTSAVGLPTLSSSTPSDNATGVSLSANIVLTFSEAVDVETGNITIKKTSGNTLVETIDVTNQLKSQVLAQQP